MRLWAFGIGLLCCCSMGLSAVESSYVRQAPDGNRWTIGNGLVEREIRFSSEAGTLATTHWRDLVSGWDYLALAASEGEKAAEVEFKIDGVKYAAGYGGLLENPTVRVTQVSPPGVELEINVALRSCPIRLAVVYTAYDGHPVIRKRVRVTNSADVPVTLSNFAVEALPLQSGKPSDLQVSAFYGSQPRELYYTGRVDDTAIIQKDSRTGIGLVVMNEVPGFLKRTEMVRWGKGVQVMYDTDLFPFERSLAPGETFTSAACSIATVKEGAGFSDPRWVVPSFGGHVLMRLGANYRPPWIYNTWEPFERGINTLTVQELIPLASRMGMDVFCIDDGWQARHGENDIDEARFPGGLDNIKAEVERAGMRLGLWIPLAAVGSDSSIVKAHPEWVCRERDGKPKMTSTAAGMQVVMCLGTPFREAAAQRINELIGRYRLRYLKIDLTTVFNTYGEAPGCFAAGHEHKTWAESLTRIYEGMKYFTDLVYREHPDVLIDLTFEVWGQKHVIDYGLLAAGDFDWLSNVEDFTRESGGPRAVRTLLYLRSLAIPTETMLIGNLHANRAPVEERLATVMGSGPLFLGDLRELSAGQVAWYGDRIRWFKSLRDAVPVFEGFFPLGAWQQPATGKWDGFARLSRKGEGLIAIFRNESDLAEVQVTLPLYPEGSFTLRPVIGSRSPLAVSGEQLRNGIKVSFATGYRAEIFEVRRQ